MTQADVAAITQAVIAAMGGKLPRKPRADKGFTKQAVAEAQSIDERRAALDAATVKAFNKAGYQDVQPRVNVLVYGKVKDDGTVTGWLAKGRKVRKGEKSIHVKAPGMKGRGIPLFHITQTDVVPAAAEQAVDRLPVENNDEIPF